MSNSKTASFPLLGILGLIFITLKLAGIGVVATWSWWLVLAPMWVPLAILGVLAMIILIIAACSK